MFNIAIQSLGSHVVVTRVSDNTPVHIERASHTQWHGPVGLAIQRGAYRSMLRTWRDDALSWWCGQQDHFADCLDVQREEVERLGGNSAIDRDRVHAGA